MKHRMNPAAPFVIAGLAATMALSAASTRAQAAEAPWQAAPGSIGNELALEFVNLDQVPMTGPLAMNIATPGWMKAVALDVPGAGELAPGASATAILHFDVAPGAALGTRGTVTLSVSSPDGGSWTEAVMLELAENPEEIQSDCCSAIEISTTGVGGSDLPAIAGGSQDAITIESYPNPSNPATRIRFSLAARADVTVAIHDVSGRLVRMLAQGSRDAGLQEIAWNGRLERGDAAPSGVYFVHVIVNGAAHAAKLVLTR